MMKPNRGCATCRGRSASLETCTYQVANSVLQLAKYGAIAIFHLAFVAPGEDMCARATSCVFPGLTKIIVNELQSGYHQSERIPITAYPCRANSMDTMEADYKRGRSSPIL